MPSQPPSAPDVLDRPAITVAIPCYEMHGRGAECLDFNLSRIAGQSHQPVEVIIPDHSRDGAVGAVCSRWEDRLPVRRLPNPHNRGSSSANLNLALANASGDLIKILCQDDFLYADDSLARTASAFSAGGCWLGSSYCHTRDRESFFDPHVPRLNPDIAAVNTIGTHSCLTIRNTPALELFDERLIWMMDCEYYRRLYDRFGAPLVLERVTVAQLLWPGQVTNTYARSRRLRSAESRYVRRKHPQPIPDLAIEDDEPR